MKILVLGSTVPQSYESAISQEFQTLGCEVLQVDDKPARWWLGGRSWWNLSRVERFAINLSASLEVYLTAKHWKPDVIFMCKAENIRSEVYTLLKKEIRCRIVVWYVDNPFHAQFSSYQALRAILKSDYYFIWAKYLIDPLKSAGATRVDYLPFGYANKVYEPYQSWSDNLQCKWNSDVCFVGTWDPEREKSLLDLANESFNLAIYGQGWKTNLPTSSPLTPYVRADSIWLGDVVKAFKGSKIVLNLLKRHNWLGHNLRTMETTGIGGGVLLTPWTQDQAENLFTEYNELLCFKSIYPENRQIEELLQNGELLKKISLSARSKVFQRHLLHSRISQILETIDK